MSRHWGSAGDPWGFQPYLEVRMPDLEGHLKISGDTLDGATVEHCLPVIRDDDGRVTEWLGQTIGEIIWSDGGYEAVAYVERGDLDYDHWKLTTPVQPWQGTSRLFVPCHTGQLHRFEDAIARLVRWSVETRAGVLAESRLETATMLDVVEWAEGRQ